MNGFTLSNIHRQKGLAALFVVLTLLVGMATISLSLSRSGIINETINGNSLHVEETKRVAEAGLDYAVAWLESNANALPGIATDATCSTDPNSVADPYSVSDPKLGCPALVTQFINCGTDPKCVIQPYTVICGGGGCAQPQTADFVTRCVNGVACVPPTPTPIPTSTPTPTPTETPTPSPYANFFTIDSPPFNNSCGSIPNCMAFHAVRIKCDWISGATVPGCPSLTGQLPDNGMGAIKLSIQFYVQYVVQYNPPSDPTYYNTNYIYVVVTALQDGNNSASTNSVYVKRVPPTATTPVKILRLPGTWRDWAGNGMD